MAKGVQAKKEVVKVLEEAFGKDWIGEFDKKFYVWGKEGTGKMQVCISLSCPKTPVGTVDDEDDGDLNFELMPPPPQEYVKAEITEEEQKTIQDLMERLGL